MNNLKLQEKKNKLKLKLFVYVLVILIPAILLTVFELISDKLVPEVSEFMYASRYIIFTVCEIWIIWKIVLSIILINNEHLLKKYEIKKQDERLKEIDTQVGSFTLKFILYIQAVVMMVYGFVNETVFYTLLISEFVIISCYMSFIIFFRKIK